MATAPTDNPFPSQTNLPQASSSDPVLPKPKLKPSRYLLWLPAILLVTLAAIISLYLLTSRQPASRPGLDDSASGLVPDISSTSSVPQHYYLWQPYSDINGRYTIRAPHPFFTIYPQPLTDSSMPHTQIRPSASHSQIAEFSLTIVSIPVETESLIQAISQHPFCPDLTVSQPYLLNGMSALIYPDQPCGDSQTTLIFTLANGRLYQFLIASQTPYSQLVQTIQPIINTFRILPTQLSAYVDPEYNFTFHHPSSVQVNPTMSNDQYILNLQYQTERIQINIVPRPQFYVSANPDSWSTHRQLSDRECDICNPQTWETVYRHADEQHLYTIRELEVGSDRTLAITLLDSFTVASRQLPLVIQIQPDLDCSQIIEGDCFDYRPVCDNGICTCEPGSCL